MHPDVPSQAGASATHVGSVYVHAPFCARRCVYCDFAVQVRSRGDVDEWAGALRAELDHVHASGLFRLEDRLRTLYVGGGTPSLLGATAMERLAELLGPDRLLAADLDWTAEANPESLSPEVASSWRSAGVRRLSLGVQSFDESALRWMGRLHGPQGARDAVETARSAGFEDLSVDLIFGLPDGVRGSWSADLAAALELEVPHVSLYGLTVEAGTRLGRSVAEGREQPADEERYREEFLEAARTLTEAGYHHYEVSNFALPGKESRHNSVYWSGAPYLGLGNGAHSYAHPIRRWNERDWSVYRDRVALGAGAEAERETLDDEATSLERVWLGLRTADGLPIDDIGEGGRAVIGRWDEQEWAHVDEGRVGLTPEGWLLLDRLAVELASALTG